MHTATISPLSSQHSVAPAQGLSETRSPWRALIVDDHALVRQMIRIILESYSEIVEVVGEASDGDEAVAQAKVYRPDFVLMDVNLPDKSGVDATRDIKQILPNVVILGISAEYTPKVYNSMIAAGAVAFIRKEDAADLLFKTIVYAMVTYCPSHVLDKGTGFFVDEQPYRSLRA